MVRFCFPLLFSIDSTTPTNVDSFNLASKSNCFLHLLIAVVFDLLLRGSSSQPLSLFRTTVAKATLTSNDGNMMAVFASALDQDFAGADGVALQKAVDSFVATNQSTA